MSTSSRRTSQIALDDGTLLNLCILETKLGVTQENGALMSGTKPNVRHQAGGGGSVLITSSVRDRERYDLVDDRRDVATRLPRALRGRLVTCLEHSGRDQHQRLVRHLPLGLGFSTSQDFNGDIRADRVLRRVLDPRHGAALARRSVRVSYGQCATRHASLDRHGRGRLPDGVA
jgi:hypothetical protein